MTFRPLICDAEQMKIIGIVQKEQERQGLDAGWTDSCVVYEALMAYLRGMRRPGEKPYPWAKSLYVCERCLSEFDSIVDIVTPWECPDGCGGRVVLNVPPQE